MTLGKLREALTEYLVSKEVHAVSGWNGAAMPRHSHPVAVVSVQALSCPTPNHRRYLGQQENAETSALEEVYGQLLSVTFSLKLCSPTDQPEGCLSLFDQVGEALFLGGPEDLTPESLSCGELSYDRELGMLVCPCQLHCSGWLCAAYDEEGLLIREFIVKGEPSV